MVVVCYENKLSVSFRVNSCWVTFAISSSRNTNSQFFKIRRFGWVAPAILENDWGKPAETSYFEKLAVGVARRRNGK